jgi:hypothetical protein
VYLITALLRESTHWGLHRRGKDSNLRRQTPTLHLGLLRYGPEQSYL